MGRSGYLTTGELAKLMHVTKNTLFHYDKIGLFSPEIVEDNEYRYYSIHQIEMLDAIIMLKELGMPLGEIRTFMEGRNPQSLMELFEREENQIEDQIKKLKDRKRWIQEKRDRVEDCLAMETERVFIRHQPARYYLMGRFEEQSDTAFAEKASELIEEYEAASQSIRYEIGCIQYAGDIIEKRYDNYRNVVLLAAQKPRGGRYLLRPGGDYLTIMYKGHWENIGGAYERLLEYAKENRLFLGQEFLEIYVIDQLMAEKMEDYVTEINVRII